MITVFTLDPLDVLIVSIVVLYIGLFLNRRLGFLSKNFIPPAVSGGLLCAAGILAVREIFDLEINFDMELRDNLLLVFFSTIGLAAKMRTLVAGGKVLAILVLIAGLFLIVQDLTGVGLALLMGVHPGYGLMGGSVSFAGGHGTAIAWGAEAELAGLVGAGGIGIAFATFGLIAGGVLGGPIARQLMKRYRLSGPDPDQAAPADKAGKTLTRPLKWEAGDLRSIMTAILVLAICVEVGSLVNRWVSETGVLLPGFLTSMFVGIVITNLAEVTRFEIHPTTIEKFGEVSLNIFLSMSLMNMKLWTLAAAAAPIVVVLMAQMMVITLFAVFIVFRVMGRNYDASVITAGFVGLGLGATPVAIANMDALTRRFGPSPLAFLVIPLVGAFFIDIMNAVVIKSFIEVISRWLT